MLFHSATLSLLIIAALDRLFVRTMHPLGGVLLIDWALTILVLGGLRAIGRLSREELSPRLWRSGYRKALIVGANQSGETLARHLLSDRRLKYQPLGYLDQDAARIGSTLRRHSDLGTARQCASTSPRRLGVEDILVISGVLDRLRVAQADGGFARSADHASRSFRPTTTCCPASYSPQIRDVDINDLAAPRAGEAQQRRHQHAGRRPHR